MSLQRVLEIARKNGMPVIITDDSGREPIVILTLEQFEALTAEGPKSSVLRPTFDSQVSMTRDAGRRTQDDGLVDAIAEMEVERAKSRMEEAASQLENLAEQTKEPSEISLEERFYLEPLEDEG